MELDSRIVRPFDPIHSECGSQQSISSRDVVLLRRAQLKQKRVGEKYETAAGTEYARGFRDPLRGIGPQAGALFRDREIKTRVRIRHVLRVSMNQRKIDAVFALKPPRRRKLLL